MFEMMVAGQTDTGRARQNNEDAFIVVEPLMVVADGMGGAAAGEIASSIAIDVISSSLKDISGLSDTEIQKKTEQAILKADAVIKAAPGKIWAVQLTGALVANSMIFYDDVDSANGTVVYDIVAPCKDDDASAARTIYFSFVDLGGIPFSVGCYVDWKGTGAVGYVWTS